MNDVSTKDSENLPIQSIPAGTTLIHEKERSRKMFIIRKGKVRVYKNYMNQRITLAILGEGEVFGELSFFDAEPRSASVEALTDLQVIAIDGEKAQQQVAQLPDWVIPIFKSVFHRFREADQKITVLQSMNEFQKRNFKTDTVGKTIYLELLRFIKTLEILFERENKGGQLPGTQLMQQELDEVLGKRYIGLKVFWRLLKEYDFIDHQIEESKGFVSLRMESLKAWKDYLHEEVESERYLILSHASLALLRRLVSQTRSIVTQAAQNQPTTSSNIESTQNFDDTVQNITTITYSEIKVDQIPLYEEAIKELTTKKILNVSHHRFMFDVRRICHIYLFQSILKSFDHTIVNLD